MKYLYIGALFIVFIALLNVVMTISKKEDAIGTQVQEEYKKSH